LIRGVLAMKRILLLCVAAALVPALVFGGDDKRKGTAGAQQVLIPVGARSIATGGAFVPSLKGVEAIYYNPAGLSTAGSSEAMFSYMSYLADINVSYVAVSADFPDLGAFGVSFKALSFGDIPQTTFALPDGNGTTFSPGFYVLGLTYSKTITDRVSAGFTTKIVNESILSTSATGFAVDFGVQYRFPNNLMIGAVLKNVGSDMKYTGTDLQTRTDIPDAGLGTSQGTYSPETEPFQIPSNFEMGVNYTYSVDASNALLVGATFRNNNTLQDEMMFGLEYKLMNIFSLRGGYETYMKDAAQSIHGFNLGAGIEYELESAVRFSFDYAFKSVKDFPTDNHVFTVKIGL
jgi:hypothetical protein